MRSRVMTYGGELVPWLEECRWFHDGTLRAASPLPSPSSTPARVVLELETIVRDGGYRAGNMQTFRKVRLEAEGVREWSGGLFQGGLPWQFNGDGVLVIDAEEGVAIEIAAPEDAYSRLHCDRLVVASSEDREQRIRPFASPSWVSATVAQGMLPAPADWVEAFRARGRAVVWRNYSGEARAAACIPDEYTGWFLQVPERIPIHQQGLFFAWAKPKGRGFELTLEMQDEGAREILWPMACAIIGGLPEATIQSGNCFFTPSEWKRFLADGTFPSSAQDPPIR